jgi:hypothetical protein
VDRRAIPVRGHDQEDVVGRRELGVDRAIRNLRAKLRNDGRRPRYIATVAGQGDHFVPMTAVEVPDVLTYFPARPGATPLS